MECEEIERTFPSSFRLVPHNVSGIPATLWLTMWTECEEFVSLNEDPYYQITAYIFGIQLNFRFIKSPVWHRKSPVTGHEPDSKKCLVCEPDLMFVTHLTYSYFAMASS